MRTSVGMVALIALFVGMPARAESGGVPSHLEQKTEAVQIINGMESRMTELSDEIWQYAETALRETRSSKALADWAESLGFAVTRGVAGMPTAFVAEFGTGSPVIGIMGEYDALPGISQKAQSEKEALEPGAAGHGCGHNLFGVASLAAANAVKTLIEDGELAGTIRFFGTPAEESVGGKIYMQRDGIFEGVDVMLAWHPSDETVSDTKSSQAIVDLIVEFEGQSAHAAYDPWNARSAADAAELFTHGINLMREHVKPSVRMHYTVVEAGIVPNVVPEYARIWLWLRDLDIAGVEHLLDRARNIATGVATATETTAKITVQSGDWNMLPNVTGQRAAWNNMNWLGSVQFTEEEHEFARRIQRASGAEEVGLRAGLLPFDETPGPPEGGSTDVADVSWNTPTLHLSVTTAPAGTPWHGWPVVACGGMSIGHKGMLHAAKALATTMVDLYLDPDLRTAIRAEFDEKTKDVEYRAFIPEGPPPIPEN